MEENHKNVFMNGAGLALKIDRTCWHWVIVGEKGREKDCLGGMDSILRKM